MVSGGPTQRALSPILAAGKNEINTVQQPGPIIGPPTCGIGPVIIGHTCKSKSLAANGMFVYFNLS
jgi:hypothetical protein